MEDCINPNLYDCFMQKNHPKIEDNKNPNLDILSHFSHYTRKYAISIHFWIEVQYHVSKKFPKVDENRSAISFDPEHTLTQV